MDIPVRSRRHVGGDADESDDDGDEGNKDRDDGVGYYWTKHPPLLHWVLETILKKRILAVLKLFHYHRQSDQIRDDCAEPRNHQRG